MSQTIKELSRHETVLNTGAPITALDIIAGCLQRIADALEAMLRLEGGVVDDLTREVVALKVEFAKLKKKGAGK